MKQKFCLNSVSSFNQINKSLTNNSKAKQTFSFGRNPRFESIKPLCQKSTYGGDFIMHKPQGKGIGYGQRSDFTKCMTVSPSSSKYTIRSDFESNLSKRRGSSLALGRQQVGFNSYISKEGFKIPSSTLYQFEKVNNKFGRNPSYSLRDKPKVLDRSMTIDPEVHNPGPGCYNSPQVSRTSKFSQIAYGTSKSRRFDSSDNKIPGVGNYHDEIQLSKFGKYSVSKYKGGTQAKFSKTSRATFIDEKYKFQRNKPAPGFYRTPSQFGQYDGNVYGATMGKFTNIGK